MSNMITVRALKTFVIHLYHPLLRKIVTLATMICEDETTQTFITFWNLFNEVIQKFSGDSKKVYNLFEWMGDEVGAMQQYSETMPWSTLLPTKKAKS